MSHNSNFCRDFHMAVELIGRRWSGAIVREMLAGATRFTEIRDAIPDLSERMLCARLRELELAGVVSRVAHAETPVRVEYLLTEKGRALDPVVAAIGEWADCWSGREKVIPSPSAALRAGRARDRSAHESEHPDSLAGQSDPWLPSG